MSVERMLKAAIETGEVLFGLNQCEKAVKKKKAKLLVFASNCPDTELSRRKAKTYRFEGTNVDLGQACGKPFPISALVVIDDGNSGILSLVGG